MHSYRLLACALALALLPHAADAARPANGANRATSPPAAGVASTARTGAAAITTDLYGKGCRALAAPPRSAGASVNPGGSTRRCTGASGFALLVHENAGRSSIDIVAPGKQAWQLDLWDVVAPGLSQVGRKAEWRMAAGLPTALLVRVDSIDTSNMVYPRTATAITVARIDHDGACVTFKVDARVRGAEAQARKAAMDRSLKCLGAYSYAGAALPTPM